MVERKTTAERFYRVGNKYRVHDSRGKILKWENIPEDLKEFDFTEGKKGQYRIQEWVLHFIPTKGDNRPSSLRNWEVRILAPQGVSREQVREYAEEILGDFTNYEMVETSNVDFVKEGVDVVEYSDNANIRYMIVDTIRPQFKYPKNKQWGDYLDL